MSIGKKGDDGNKIITTNIYDFHKIKLVDKHFRCAKIRSLFKKMSVGVLIYT